MQQHTVEIGQFQTASQPHLPENVSGNIQTRSGVQETVSAQLAFRHFLTVNNSSKIFNQKESKYCIAMNILIYITVLPGSVYV